MYTNRPDGFWYNQEKTRYNLDGSIKESYKKRLLAKGRSLKDIADMEESMKKELSAYHERTEFLQKEYGMSYEEWRRKQSGGLSQAQIDARTRQGIREGEEISALSGDVDPDDYYDGDF